jgi:hypothetical protein
VVVEAEVIALVIAGGGAGYLVGSSRLRTTVVVSTTTLPATFVNKSLFGMNVNGSLCYADDI